jgi:predicted unusual protein kinase regulating ubiquinone biosynthesis (AarF/ABC1/UbiB family)
VHKTEVIKAPPAPIIRRYAPPPGPSPAELRMRHVRIALFFTGLVLHFLWWDVFLKHGLLSAFRTPWVPRWQQNTRRYKELALQWQGLWVKLGQFLSTRVDILPLAITGELESLRDDVPAEPGERIVTLLEAEFNCSIAKLFSSFSPSSIGSGSLAQVHRARSLRGEPVVVKVLRPHIREIVTSDLVLLRKLAGGIKHVKPLARRADVDGVVNEFSQVTSRELDMRLEARNIERFGEDFATDPQVGVPRIHYRESSTGVLTMQDVAYIRIDDVGALERVGISPKAVARKVYRVYLRQFFITYRIHADPHPGNIFVRPLPTAEETTARPYPTGFEPSGPVPSASSRPFALFFVDFGMMVEMPPRFRDALREFVIGLGTRDARRILNSYSQVGVVPADADLGRVQEMIQEQLDDFWGTFMGQVRPDDLTNPKALAFFNKYEDLMRATPFQFQAEMLFMMRAMGILSGVTVGLDPTFDPWRETAPFAMQLLVEDLGQEFIETVVSSAGDIAEGRFPIALLRILQPPPAAHPPPAAASSESSREVARLRGAVNRLAAATVVTGLFVVGAVLFANDVRVSDVLVQLWPGDRIGLWLMELSAAGLVFMGLRRSS